MKTKKFFSLFIFIILLFFVSIAHADDTDVSFDVNEMDPDFHDYMLKKFDTHGFEYDIVLAYAGLKLGPTTEIVSTYEKNGKTYYKIKYEVWGPYYADGSLDTLEIEKMKKYFQETKTADVRPLMKGLHYFPNLTYVNCNYFDLTELDVSKNPALETLLCKGNQLTRLNISNNKALKSLECQNNKLTELDLSNNPALILLNCSRNQLTGLDVSKNKALVYLSCSYNQITELDLSRNDALSNITGDPMFYVYDTPSLNQEIKGLKIKVTDRGFEADLKDYVSKLENIVDVAGYVDNYNSDGTYNSTRTIVPSSYDASRGVVVFSERPNRIIYTYDTHLPNSNILETYRYMKVAIFNEDSVMNLYSSATHFYEMDGNHYYRYEGGLLKECTDSDSTFYENRLPARFLFSDSRVGFVADGNSRLLLTVQTNKPGYVTFSLKDDIGAKLEKISDRSAVNENTPIKCQGEGYLTGYLASVVLAAPDSYPHDKKFPVDTFKVHAKFIADDGTTAEADKTLEIDAAPVVLVHGLLGNSKQTFGDNQPGSVASTLKNMGFDVHYFDFNESSTNICPYLFTHLNDIFSSYDKREVVCTRADVVAFGRGGLIVRDFLQKEKEPLPVNLAENPNSQTNWSPVSYGQGMIRSFVSIAVPFYGTPWANILSGMMKFPYVWKFAEEQIKSPAFLAVNLILKKNIDEFFSLLGSYEKEAVKQMAVAASANNKQFPDYLPTYAIYGDIGDAKGIAEELAMETGKIICDNFDNTIKALILNLALVEAPLRGAEIAALKFAPRLLPFIQGVSTANDLQSLYNDVKDFINFSNSLNDAIKLNALYMGKNVVFSGETNDLIVSASSAKGNMDSSKVFTGWQYRHDNICFTYEVGHDIGLYLQFLNLAAEKSNRSKENTASIKAKAAASSTYSTSGAPVSFDNMEFQFIEAMRLNVNPSFLSISSSDNTKSKAKFSVFTAKPTSYDVYCAVENEEKTRLAVFKIPNTDGKGRKFELDVIFTSNDIGRLKAFCFSHNPEDNEGKSIHISNTFEIAAALSLKDFSKDINVVPPNYNIYLKGGNVNVNSEIPFGIYRLEADGKYYDIASLSPDISYIIEPSDVITITENGMIRGLKEGSAFISVNYKDWYSSWVHVWVNPELKDIQCKFPSISVSGGTSPHYWEIVDGSLPAGMYLDNGIDGFNTVWTKGKPSAPGKYNFTIKVTDATGASVEKQIKGAITKPKITGSLINGVLNRTYNRTLNVSSDFRPWNGFTMTTAGKLPDGLKIDLDKTNNQIKVYGTPAKTGTFSFDISIQDNYFTETKNFKIKITKPAISGTLTTSGLIKKSYSSELTVSGGTSPYTWTKSGTLPTGLKITSADNKITLSGIPTKAGKFTFTLKATDKNNLYVSKKFTLKISPIFTGSLAATGKVKTAYTGTLTASKNTSAYTWTKSGTLPTGLKITSADNKITLSGTPTKAGKFTFTLKATDKNNLYVSKKFTVKISPIFTGSFAATGKVKTAYTGTLTASKNTTVYTWTKSGTLPTGLKLTTIDNKATLSGKPTKAGKFTFTIKATDKNNLYVSKKFTVTIVKDSTTKAKADSVNSDIDKSKEDLTTKAPLQADSPGVDSSKNEILKTELNGVEFVTTELKVLSEDILWQGEGRDEDLVGVCANKPLTFIIENALSDMKVIIDDYKTEDIEIYEGSFTLPAEFVSDDFKVRVEDAVIETNELFISVEK